MTCPNLFLSGIFVPNRSLNYFTQLLKVSDLTLLDISGVKKMAKVLDINDYF